MKVEIELPELPDGWEYTGEFRRAEHGEYIAMFADNRALVVSAECRADQDVFIVKPKRWRAERHDEYWYFASRGFLQSDIENGSAVDALRWKFGNYFKTAQEAEAVLEKVEALLLSLHD